MLHHYVLVPLMNISMDLPICIGRRTQLVVLMPGVVGLYHTVVEDVVVEDEEILDVVVGDEAEDVVVGDEEEVDLPVE